MVATDGDSWIPDDTLRILIASDIHLGHKEDDPIRGEDSFIAFEEVLSLAVQYDVDLILLGGDLFDHAKPTPSCLFKATQLLRKYCFGDKPVAVELLSDQLENFARSVNYEDPNLNVAYPILSIHGNHDDPVGQGHVSSLDILSITGLVNYFGKWTDYTHVRISPVLMQKGATRLALYGLSHLKDQRLSRLFLESKVEMERPEDGDDWFNLLVLHQNRADRGPGNYIPEKILPKFLDVVVWGHEHDSLVFPEKTSTDSDRFTVIQPGSTVATSLAAGEALPKHCALLQIHKNEYSITPLPLKTVRPFIFKTIVLSEENLGEESVNESEQVQEFLKGKINEAIEEANRNLSGDPKQPTIPLVRLNVMYEKESQSFNNMRFGQNFNGLVANPSDILNMKREKRVRERKVKEEEENGDLNIEGAAHAADVEELLRAYYAALPVERRLQVLSVRAMTDAVRDFTLKHDDEVFRRVFEAHKRRCVEMLLESNAETEEEVAERLRSGKQELDGADEDQLKKLIDAAAAKPPTPGALKRAIVVLSSDDEAEEAITARGRGARGGRARGAARARGARGRGRNHVEPEPAHSPSPSPVPERRTPRRSAAQKSASWLQNFAERSTRQRGSIDIEDDSD